MSITNDWRALEDPANDTMSEREKEALTTIAKSMTESLLESTDLLGSTPWCLVHEKHGISLFRADVGNNVPCNVHAVCKVTCEIEDVAESMITSTTEEYTKMMELLSSDFIEGAVIENIVEPTEQNPHRYVGLKWAAFKSSSKFMKDRDFTILEYVDMIEDEQGQKIAVRVMESVDVPRSSKFAESTKYVRDVVPLMGFMYHHTTKKPSELRMTYTCNFDNGDLPAWAANSAIQSHVEKCINGILKYIETFRAQKETIVLPQQVMSMCEQDHCKVCQRNFCVLRRRYNCLKCGGVICSSCSRIRNAVVPDHGERPLRVCTACVLEVRRTSRFATDSPCRSGSSSSSRGGSAVATTLCGSPGRQMQMPMMRTQSFSSASTSSTSAGAGTGTGKRRSYDDLLEPVRSRLMEHKSFSSSPEAMEIPKATFPLRSLSDGFVMRRNNFFSSRRRGSPADLAISIDAFRQGQQQRSTGVDFEPEDGDLTDTDESLRQFEYFSAVTSGGASSGGDSDDSSPTSTGSTHSPVPSCRQVRQRQQQQQQQRQRSQPESGLSPLHATQPLIEDGKRTSRKRSAFENKIGGGAQIFPTMSLESRSKLDEAITRSQLIIDDASYANNLAQHARKLSHRRVVALQREYDVLPPPPNNSNNQLETRSAQRVTVQPVHVGATLLENGSELDQKIVLLTQALEQVVYTDTHEFAADTKDRRRQHASHDGVRTAPTTPTTHRDRSRREVRVSSRADEYVSYQ